MKMFYELHSKNEQDLHLQRTIEIKEITRKRKRIETEEGKEKPKSESVQYFLIVDGQRIQVCKKAFINVYNISNKRIRRLVDLLENNITPVDMRGKNISANTMPYEYCQKIHEHILSFPTKDTHYTTQLKKYLDPKLNVKTMHTMFMEQYPELEGKIKYQYYWEYFKNNFSLSFGAPVKDACSKCEELNTKIMSKDLNDVAKRVAAAELLVHKNRSKKFYNNIKKTVEISQQNKKVLGLCFDFMAVVDLPKIPVQEVYYYRQLSVNTFGIHNLSTNNLFCYVYHEATARKSPNDVCSFLVHYINNFVGEDVEELHLFCDNCAGQNKNHALLRMIMALVEIKKFKKVQVFFPQRGHSFLPCDRDFALIKKQLNRVDRLYTLDEYVELIIKSSKNPEKFLVILVDKSMIYDFQIWFPQFYIKTTNALECLSRNKTFKQRRTIEKFLISKYYYFECVSEKSGIIKASEFIDGIVSYHFKLRKNNTIPIQYPKTLVYDSSLPILESKMKDLKQLAKYIPEPALQSFWNFIFSLQTETLQARQNRT